MDVMVLVLTRAPVPAFRDAFGPGHLYSAETLPHHKERPGALQRTGNPGLPPLLPYTCMQSRARARCDGVGLVLLCS